MSNESDAVAFPKLDPDEIERVRSLGEPASFADGDTIVASGHADADFFVVESGQVDVLNPTNDGHMIASHGPGEFVGDIDLLTGRPIIFTAVARGQTQLIRVCGEKLRRVLNTVPRLSEKLLVAFQVRRQMVRSAGVVGIRVLGGAHCAHTNAVREFLHKNFVPFTWYDPETPAGEPVFEEFGRPDGMPLIECGDGRVLKCPSLRELAECTGIWRTCPSRTVDLAVIGSGPAGMAAAVYAASEGLSTLVLDRVGPGGQAGGSSLIENFIGFPSGLSGTDLATRGVLQMLKFGAKLIAPMSVERLDPAAGPDDSHVLHLDCGATVHANVVLVATGATWKRLPAAGAHRFERAGIYYACTAVEAGLHEGQDVAVVGGGNSAGQAAMYLAENCARSVHLVVRGDTFGDGMSRYLADRIKSTRNITLHTCVEIASVQGTAGPERVTLRTRDGTPADPPHLDVTGIFVFIGAQPHVEWLPDSVARNENGYVLTGSEVSRAKRWPLDDRDPCALETSIPRVLAAGDVRAGSTKRVGFAVGDGSLAVTCVHQLRRKH